MTQRLPPTLSSLDAALYAMLDGLRPVTPVEAKSTDPGVVAEDAFLPTPHPAYAVALIDGWALRAYDTTGASSYAPSPIATAPVWVEAGARMPDGCDCVVDADLVEHTGPVCQVLGEAIPGAGLRRAGDDIPAERQVVAQGLPLSAIDRLVARAARIDRLLLRSPRVYILDVPAADGSTTTSQFIAEFAMAAGASTTTSRAATRDAAGIAAALEGNAYDLVLTVGGSGVGRTDETITALAARGANLIHGLAVQPGRTVGVGRLGSTPVIAIPGAPDQALAVSLTLIQPVLDRLSARRARSEILRPLARKISSSVGVAEIILLQETSDMWMPIAVGHLSLDAITRADAWLAVPAESEGYAAATSVGALPLRVML